MTNRIGLRVLAAMCAAAAIRGATSPACAGWDLTQRTYSVTASKDRWSGGYCLLGGQCQYYDCEDPECTQYPPLHKYHHWWQDLYLDTSGSSNVGAANGCPHVGPASARTAGSITCTVPYVGGTPPSKVWIHEVAHAAWWAECGGSGMAAASYGTYYVETPDGLGGRYGDAYGDRFRLADVNMSALTVSGTGHCYCSVTQSAPYPKQIVASISYTISEVRSEDNPPPTAERKAGPPWKRNLPYHPIKPIMGPGGIQGGGDPVDLATGDHAYVPGPDISVYNPYGPAVVYQRNFHSGRARDGYAARGLSVGWVDNYDATITPELPGSWSNLTVTYPNGGQDELEYTQTSETLVTLGRPAGAPYIAKAQKSGVEGQWEWIEITWKDRSKWTFLPAGTGTYLLGTITNRMSRYIAIVRDPANNYRVASVTDDQPSPTTLLTLAYAGGNLASVTDAYGRRITYTFDGSNLGSVSQIAPSGASSPPVHWTYGYQTISGQPHLVSVGFPSPTGSGVSTQHVNYDTSTGRVASLVDANGNQHVFAYEYNNGTRVQIKNPSGVVEQEFIQNFDPENSNRDIGVSDAKGYCTTLVYGDANNPSRPTIIRDKNGKETLISYDQYGNVESVTSPRGTVTDYVYDDVSPLRRLRSVQEGTKAATTFDYYEPSGLVQTITGPAPGGSGTAHTDFTYDPLGNVLTVDAPGNDASSRIVTTYTYGSTPKLGQPLTITDNLSHTASFGYDDRGNALWSQDAAGYRTDFTYNIADQVLTVIHPTTAEPP